MQDVLRKYINVRVVKDLGDSTLEIVASDESQDRDGDVIRQSGWQLDRFKSNPVILWAHDYHDLPIARALSVKVVKRQLKAVIKFAEHTFAQEVYALYKEGFLNAFSVGMVVLDWRPLAGSDRGREYMSQELLEISGVPIPANPNALVSARSAHAASDETIAALVKSFEAGDYERTTTAEKTAEAPVEEDDGEEAEAEGADSGESAEDAMVAEDSDVAAELMAQVRELVERTQRACDLVHEAVADMKALQTVAPAPAPAPAAQEVKGVTLDQAAEIAREVAEQTILPFLQYHSGKV